MKISVGKFNGEEESKHSNGGGSIVHSAGASPFGANSPKNKNSFGGH
jgi:hypothetical protein